MTECGYVEALKENFDMGIHSQAFVFNHILSIEVITYEYHDKYCNDVSNEENLNMEFHSHFSDESAQSTATTCEHNKNLFTGCMKK